MSKSLPIILLVTFALTLIVPVSVSSSLRQAKAATSGQRELLTYENPNYDIKMRYPSSWVKDLNVSSPDVVTFYPSAVNSNARFTVTVDNISYEMSVAQYASDSNDAIRKRTQDFRLVESSTNNTLAGLPAFKSVYTYTGYNNSTVQGMKIGAIKGDRVYIFTYEAGPTEYYTYLPMIRNMIYSSQITSQISSQPNAQRPQISQ
jgi:eukaryotic-like serine/threonine-protein kinase